MHEKHSLSIWFFVGVLLTVYGIIILIASIPALSPSTNPHVVLEELHSGVWWGALLLLSGILFLILHWPGKKPSALDDKDPEGT